MGNDGTTSGGAGGRRPNALKRALGSLLGGAEEARRAAIERTSAKYPDAYKGYDEQPRKDDDSTS